jgi:Flp pilus assembly protein TadG
VSGRHARTRRRRGIGGATAPEFALVTPLFMLLVLLIIDFGRAVFVANSISAAARDAARQGVLLRSPIARTYPTARDIERAAQVRQKDLTLSATCAYDSTQPVPAVSNQGVIYLDRPPGGGEGGYVTTGCSGGVPTDATGHLPVTVTIIYNFRPYTGLVASAAGIRIVLRSTSSMLAEY